MKEKDTNAVRRVLLKPDHTALNRVTNIVLIILWLGTTMLVGYMAFRWHNDYQQERSRVGKDVDDMLLSTQDLEFEKIASLVNITLNTGIPYTTAKDTTSVKKEKHQHKTARKAIYEKMISQKMKNANNTSATDTGLLPQ